MLHNIHNVRNIQRAAGLCAPSNGPLNFLHSHSVPSRSCFVLIFLHHSNIFHALLFCLNSTICTLYKYVMNFSALAAHKRNGQSAHCSTRRKKLQAASSGQAAFSSGRSTTNTKLSCILLFLFCARKERLINVIVVGQRRVWCIIKNAFGRGRQRRVGAPPDRRPPLKLNSYP